LRRRVADWRPRLADVDRGLLLAREGPVGGLNVGLELPPPLERALVLRRFGERWFMPTRCSSTLAFPAVSRVLAVLADHSSYRVLAASSLHFSAAVWLASALAL
jgi:hypothetical protein